MSVFRYRIVGPSLANIQRYVDPTVNSVVNARRQTDCEIDLSDDTELPTLDMYMSSLGYVRVTGDQTTGLLTSDLVLFGASTIMVAGTEFLVPFGFAAASGLEIQFQVIGTRRFRTMTMAATAPGTGLTGNLTYTLRKNNVDTALALNVGIALVTGYVSISLVNEVEFNDTDLISLSVAKAGIIMTTPTDIMIAVG